MQPHGNKYDLSKSQIRQHDVPNESSPQIFPSQPENKAQTLQQGL